MAPLCGKSLSPNDQRVWQQAIAMLRGLKLRNGFEEKDLTAAVGKALNRSAWTSRNCEDCGIKVTSGATNSRGPQWGGGGAVPLGWHPLRTLNLLHATCVSAA